MQKITKIRLRVTKL